MNLMAPVATTTKVPWYDHRSMETGQSAMRPMWTLSSPDKRLKYAILNQDSGHIGSLGATGEAFLLKFVRLFC